MSAYRGVLKNVLDSADIVRDGDVTPAESTLAKLDKATLEQILTCCPFTEIRKLLCGQFGICRMI